MKPRRYRDSCMLVLKVRGRDAPYETLHPGRVGLKQTRAPYTRVEVRTEAGRYSRSPLAACSDRMAYVQHDQPRRVPWELTSFSAQKLFRPGVGKCDGDGRASSGLRIA